MVSVRGGMATAVALFLASAVLQVPSSAFSSPTQGRRSETPSSLGLDADTRCYENCQDPIGEAQPLSRPLARPLNVVGKRDCLGNGSDHSSDNNTDSFPSCGDCCADGKNCCESGEVCSGSECRSGDRICSEGKCLSVEPTTVTSTVLQTATRTDTVRTTLVGLVLHTDTVVSPIGVTIETVATQPIVERVTTTVEKRVVADSVKFELGNEVHLAPGLRVSRRSPIVEDEFTPAPPIQARQDGDITVTYTTIETVSTTRYSTKTSTITITSSSPEVITSTRTSSPPPPPPTVTQDDSPTPSPSAESSGLSTSAIAGISAGGSVLALFLVGFVVLSIRRRRRWRNAQQPANSVTFGDDHGNNVMDYHCHSGEGAMSPTTRRSRSSTTTTASWPDPITLRYQQPTLPRILPHFTMPAPHHDTEYRLPASVSYTGTAYGGEEWRGAGGNGFNNTGLGQPYYQQPGNDGSSRHESTSGSTTLVSTPSPTRPVSAVAQPQHPQTLQTQRRVHWADTSTVERGPRRNMGEAAVAGGSFGYGAWEMTHIPPPATVTHDAGSSKVSRSRGGWAAIVVKLRRNEVSVAELDGDCRVELEGDSRVTG